MKINKLTLTNYRGAESLHLGLNPGLNVFVGLNGAGKSTVLDAAAILLSWLINRMKTDSASGRPVAEDDIQNGKSSAALDIECENGLELASWKVAKSRRGPSGTEERSSLQGMASLVSGLRAEAVFSGEKPRSNLPVLVYYPVNRAVLDIPLRIRTKHKFDVWAAYEQAFTGGNNFRTFFEWFREREDLENENRKYVDGLTKLDGFEYPDRQLEAIRHAMTQFMPEFSNLTVRRQPLRMEVTKNGKPLAVNQLSDGEKCLMALVGDLARRLAIANQARSNPLEGEGVVLIDEIDLHLHPKWQRLVVPQLVKVFPNCQFLISTHSPHVITHVQHENLFILKQTDSGIVVERPSESYGKNVDRVLEDLMGLDTTRPDAVSSELHAIYEKIDQGRFSDARKKITELKDKIGDDPELVKAEVLIRRKELIGK